MSLLSSAIKEGNLAGILAAAQASDLDTLSSALSDLLTNSTSHTFSVAYVLISYGAKLSSLPEQAFHPSVFPGVLPLLAASSSADNSVIVELALKAAASGDISSALLIAEISGKPNEVVKGKDPANKTVLSYAVESENIEAVKALILLGADSALVPSTENKAILRELGKNEPSQEKLIDTAGKFKASGNKVFGSGEFVKASKLYSAAIHHTPDQHVFFSNRSACYFNQEKYELALVDAIRCVSLNPEWPKGYFRKGSALTRLGLIDEASKVFNQGLKLDKKNPDLLKGLEEIKSQKAKTKK